MKEFLKQKQGGKNQWLQLSSNLKILSFAMGGAMSEGQGIILVES